MSERPPDRLIEGHHLPLDSEPDAPLSDLPGFRGITMRDGNWMVDFDGPPPGQVIAEVEKRVRAHKPK